jgi:hypothetical protein
MDGSNVVIATRRYYVEPPDGDVELTLSIERPEQEEPPGYYRCGYHFTGAEQATRFAAGVDELHALISALEMAGAHLDHLNEHKYEGRLQWDGGSAKSSLPTICNHWPFLKQPGA